MVVKIKEIVKNVMFIETKTIILRRDIFFGRKLNSDDKKKILDILNNIIIKLEELFKIIKTKE